MQNLRILITIINLYALLIKYLSTIKIIPKDPKFISLLLFEINWHSFYLQATSKINLKNIH